MWKQPNKTDLILFKVALSEIHIEVAVWKKKSRLLADLKNHVRPASNVSRTILSGIVFAFVQEVTPVTPSAENVETSTNALN